MMYVEFNTRSRRETRRMWRMLKRYLVEAESNINRLFVRADGGCDIGSIIKVEGSFLDIITMCLEMKRIPKRIKILEW